MAFSRERLSFAFHVCGVCVCFTELFTGHVVRKASSLAAGLELKTILRPVLKYQRRMAIRLERNIVNP